MLKGNNIKKATSYMATGNFLITFVRDSQRGQTFINAKNDSFVTFVYEILIPEPRQVCIGHQDGFFLLIAALCMKMGE